MKKSMIAAVAVMSLALAACTTDADRCASTKNPQECMAWSDAGGSIDDYLVGGMVGYMLANRGGQTVVVANPSYHGPRRSLRSPIMSQDRQVARLQQKVQRQKVELARQQKANADKKASMKANGSWSSYRASRSSSSSSSFRSSSSRSSRRR